MRAVSRQLMIDSLDIAKLISDSAYCAQMGYTQETLPSLFIPNTYEVYWNMSADAFMKRMQKEHAAFWNNDRLKKAQHIGLTPEESVHPGLYRGRRNGQWSRKAHGRRTLHQQIE